MKKIKNLFLVLLLALNVPCMAQQIATITVKGKILMTETKEPLDLARVSFISPTDNKLVKATVSNTKGEFEISIAAGTYQVKVEHFICKPYFINNIQFSKDVSLGDIFLEEEVKQLNTVNVVASKSTVELNADKKVFNVGKDILSKGGTANDILNNVPSVNVDASGNVSLRGNGNVRVLINGKPSMLATNNGLGQIPAASIEKVEVITNPSASYEAQGGTGIINVIMKKNSLYGLNGSIQMGVGNPANYTGNVNLSYKTEKVNFFSNIGYQYRNFYGSDQRIQTSINNESQTGLHQINSIGNNDNTNSFYLGSDYYINPKNTLTGSFYHIKIRNTDTTNFKYNYYDGNSTIDSVISRFENYNEPQNFNELELNYVKTFDKKDKKWTTNLQYDFWNDDENQQISQQKLYPYSAVSTLISRDIESSHDIFLQSDFVNPLANNAKLEFGVKAALRAIRSEYSASLDNEMLGEYNNKLKYGENLYSAYVQYGKKLKKFNYLLGLRSELSDIDIADRVGTFNNSKTYINIFPTAHFVYQFQKNTELQLSYSRRINRPRFWQLNPFAGLSDPRNLTTGNPDLDPMYTGSFELGSLTKAGQITINPSVYYQRTTNYFDFIMKQKEDGPFVRTPVNLDNENRYGVEFSTIYSPLNWWRLSWDFNFYKFKQQGAYEGVLYSVEDKTWFTSFRSTMKFPQIVAVDFSFNYRGENRGVQTLTKAQYRANIGISKDLFNDKASLTLNINNLFDSQVSNQITKTDTYALESTFKGPGRQFNATMVYRFNRKKDQSDRLPDNQ